MRRVWLAAMLLVGVVAAGALAAPVSAQLPPGALLDALLLNVTHPDEHIRKEALELLGRLGDRAAIPALIDVLRFDFASDLDVAAVLEPLAGEKHGTDWKRWMEWLAGRPDIRPNPGYLLWKSALYRLIDPEFELFFHPGVKYRLRLEEIAWGGVKKDGIPALVNPRLVWAAEATYLTPDEAVLGVSINGDHRAYPLRIMDWHEMVNDVVGGTPIAVAY